MYGGLYTALPNYIVSNVGKKHKVEDKQVIVREKSTILYLTQAFENFLPVNIKHTLNDDQGEWHIQNNYRITTVKNCNIIPWNSNFHNATS